MIRRRFAYHAPPDAAAAAAALAEHGDAATVLGGGTWVVPELHDGRRAPAVVVDLRDAGLRTVVVERETVTIGATASYSDLLATPGVPSLLRTMAAGVTGGAQIRNQGTVGGSACYANPGSDAPAALLALGAIFVAVSAAGEREIAAADFFRGAFRTALRPEELLREIRIPRPPAGSRSAYRKHKLAASSWPIVTAAVLAGADGAIRSLAIGGATAAPLAIALSGGESGAEIAARVTEAVAEPWSDALADGEYRRQVAGVIATRAVAEARGPEGEDR